MTPATIGQQLNAAYVLTGSLRRAGARLRINAQLVDTHTDFPLWSERYDREMKDVFEVQDEIARRIAEALRITLTPQEQEALAVKPTENLQAYDLYLRGRSYARRLTRQDLEFALQMFENSVALDPNFALAYAAIANSCAQYHNLFEREAKWVDRATAASERASALGRDDAEVLVAEAWVLYMKEQYDESERRARRAIAKKPDAESAYYLLGRTLFAAGRYQEVVDMAEEAVAHSGDNYNIYVPLLNAMGALGKNRDNARQQSVQMLQDQLSKVPEDARARILLAGHYAEMKRVDDALQEANMAMALRPNDALVMYNVACCFCQLGKKEEGLTALRKAHSAGFRNNDWAQRDPDLALLRDEPEFQRMYPAG